MKSKQNNRQMPLLPSCTPAIQLNDAEHRELVLVLGELLLSRAATVNENPYGGDDDVNEDYA